MAGPKNFVPIELSGEQWGRFSAALQDGFPAHHELSIFVRECLAENLAVISSPENPLRRITYDIIQWAQGRGLGGNLMQAARLVRPGNPKIQAIAAELLDGDIVASRADEAPESVSGRKLERIVRQDLGFADATLWWQALGAILPRVCCVQVELGSERAFGTGFLVGPAAVLTNQHVVAGVIGKHGGGTKVRCLFDYQRVRTSKAVVNSGTPCALDSEWLIDSSEPGPLDEQHEPDGDKLDYALLRLADAIGEQPLGGSIDPKTANRGYLSILDARPPPGPGSALYIVQHPEGDPIALALDTNAIIWTKKTRVRYRTNTEHGSSGSPCFDAQWNPVALHHLGDPSYTATYNQGIPLTAIVTLLRERGRADELGP